MMAVLVGLVPSVVAFSIGLLPAVLLPMIPFIMIANMILVLVFSFLKDKNYWLGMVSAAFLKFGFLFIVSSIVVNFFITKPVGEKIAMIMSWPQLLTALVGGLIAYLFIRTIKK